MVAHRGGKPLKPRGTMPAIVAGTKCTPNRSAMSAARRFSGSN